jgi:hypothetical protein
MSGWAVGELWLKAKMYSDKASDVDQSSSDFPFWSSLSLELLGRAALSHIHPVLNADPQDEANILYALGINIASQPRSIPAHSVYLRCEKLIEDFKKPQREICDYIALKRNQEIHTGELPFEDFKLSEWLPRYYEAAAILCEAIDKSLADLLGDEIAQSAEKLIAALNKGLETSVKSMIAAHAKVFNLKPPDEQAKLRTTAEVVAQTYRRNAVGHVCPACGSRGVLAGELIKSMKPVLEEGDLIVEQVFLASQFTCTACGLNLKNINEIHWANIEPRFSLHASTSLHELYQPEYEDEYDNM